jgi:hypothetical protein
MHHPRASIVALFGFAGLCTACSSNSASPSPDAGSDVGDLGSPDSTVVDAAAEGERDAAGDAGGGSKEDVESEAGEAGDDGGNGVDGVFGAACVTSSTCDGGDCLFAVDGGCDAGGRCFYHMLPPGRAECHHSTGMCACNGTGTYQLDCEAPGYAEAPVPSATAFVCASDGGPDGSPDGG